MEQTKKQRLGFGFYGWMPHDLQHGRGILHPGGISPIYPMNILADFYGGRDFCTNGIYHRYFCGDHLCSWYYRGSSEK